ncbi:MAG: mechanosensitive ion channel domain-containing protein, partial [Bacteroidota bacterium]
MKTLFHIAFFLLLASHTYGQSDTLQTAIDSVGTLPPKSSKLADQINKVSEAVTGIPVVNKTITEAPAISDLVSVSKVVWAMVFLLLGYFVIKFTSRILELFAERSTQYRISVKSFIPVVKILGWIGLVFVIIAGVFRPPVNTVLAFSASVGVAIGFASQDILKNIFGGIIILFDRPFQSGDKIEVGSF